MVLVVEFKEMQAGLQRTTIYNKDRVEYTKLLPDLRELFRENMPQVLADHEAQLQQDYSKKLLDNEGLAKRVSRYLKNLFAMESETGTENIEEVIDVRGRETRIPVPGPKPPKPRPTPPLPGPHFGPDPIEIGLKNLEGKKRARKADPNPLPKFELTKSCKSWIVFISLS